MEVGNGKDYPINFIPSILWNSIFNSILNHQFNSILNHQYIKPSEYILKKMFQTTNQFKKCFPTIRAQVRFEKRPAWDGLAWCLNQA
jgi:hypothetical protein